MWGSEAEGSKCRGGEGEEEEEEMVVEKEMKEGISILVSSSSTLPPLVGGEGLPVLSLARRKVCVCLIVGVGVSPSTSPSPPGILRLCVFLPSSSSGDQGGAIFFGASLSLSLFPPVCVFVCI